MLFDISIGKAPGSSGRSTWDGRGVSSQGRCGRGGAVGAGHTGCLAEQQQRGDVWPGEVVSIFLLVLRFGVFEHVCLLKGMGCGRRVDIFGTKRSRSQTIKVQI